jgi:hypothetical protein
MTAFQLGSPMTWLTVDHSDSLIPSIVALKDRQSRQGGVALLPLTSGLA